MGASESRLCPRCGTQRIGSFRWCRECQFDFEAPPSAPIDPPRPVNSPTPRRKGLNSVMDGAGAALDAFAAGASAEYRERGTMAAETSNEERTTKSRRFMRRTKQSASPPQLAAPESFSTTRGCQI